MKWATLCVVLLTGCAAGQITAETARVVACTEAGEEIVSRAEAGELDPDNAQCMLRARDLVCDRMHAAIEGAGE